MRRITLALFVMTLALVGCAPPPPSIVGTWTTEGDLRGAKTRTEATFLQGGKYEAKTEFLDGEKVQMVAQDSGTWKLEEDKLTIKLNDVDWNFPSTADDPEKAEQAQETFRKNKTAILESVNSQGPITLTWVGPDEMQASLGDSVHTYKRKR